VSPHVCHDERLPVTRRGSRLLDGFGKSGRAGYSLDDLAGLDRRFGRNDNSVGRESHAGQEVRDVLARPAIATLIIGSIGN
jgi:hypothetical protein